MQPEVPEAVKAAYKLTADPLAKGETWADRCNGKEVGLLLDHARRLYEDKRTTVADAVITTSKNPFDVASLFLLAEAIHGVETPVSAETANMLHSFLYTAGTDSKVFKNEVPGAALVREALRRPL